MIIKDKVFEPYYIEQQYKNFILMQDTKVLGKFKTITEAMIEIKDLQLANSSKEVTLAEYFAELNEAEQYFTECSKAIRERRQQVPPAHEPVTQREII